MRAFGMISSCTHRISVHIYFKTGFKFSQEHFKLHIRIIYFLPMPPGSWVWKEAGRTWPIYSPRLAREDTRSLDIATNITDGLVLVDIWDTGPSELVCDPFLVFYRWELHTQNPLFLPSVSSPLVLSPFSALVFFYRRMEGTSTPAQVLQFCLADLST